MTVSATADGRARVLATGIRCLCPASASGLRWDLQRGLPVITKSTHRERIHENVQIFDFTLSELDMAELDALDQTNGTDRALERRPAQAGRRASGARCSWRHGSRRRGGRGVLPG
jgi:hypothetical protein